MSTEEYLIPPSRMEEGDEGPGLKPSETKQWWGVMSRDLLKTAAFFPVADYGAVGDGVTDDSDALEAAIAAAAPVNGTLVFQPGATYLLSRTIYGASSLRWEFNRTVFLASPTGTYDPVLLLGGGDSGLDVFFAVDGGERSIYHGRLSINCNNVANLCGISAHDSPGNPNGQGMQVWEHLRISNCTRGIFALNQGPQGRTILGHHFGIVEFTGNLYDLWIEDDGADDAIFHIVRSQSATDGGGTAVRIINSRGVTIHSLFLNLAGPGAPPSPPRDGIVIFAGSSLFCEHVYLEDDFSRPIAIGDASNVTIKDLKLGSTVFGSDNGQVIRITADCDSCVVDILVNFHAIASPATHIVEIEADNVSTYGRIVRVRMPFLTTDKPPVVYTGVGASDNDDVVVEAENGRFRYFYDGATLSQRREPLVNGGAVAATTLGSVARRMEVFDAQGNSLGFVPIYDSIT